MAFKEKEHDYKKLEKDIAGGIIDEQRILILRGHEDYLVKSYEKRIRDLFINPAAAELDYVRLDGESISVDDIISHSDTLPMLSPKRIVSVSSFSSEEDEGRLSEYLNDIPESTLLIFLGDSIDMRKALGRKMSKAGKSYNFDRLDRKDLSSFIKKRFKSEGKQANDNVIREIINSTGYFDRDSDYNLNCIAGDIVKISSFSRETAITPADVSSVLSTSLETDAFALLDSLSRGSKGDAMLLINNIMDTGESSFKLLGLIISQFELMLGIKEYSIRNMNKDEIMNEMGIKSDFRYKKAAGFAADYSSDKLYDILTKLYEVEKNIKSGIYNEKLAMTMFVSEI